jgi:hypothetical protein
MLKQPNRDPCQHAEASKPELILEGHTDIAECVYTNERIHEWTHYEYTYFHTLHLKGGIRRGLNE